MQNSDYIEHRDTIKRYLSILFHFIIIEIPDIDTKEPRYELSLLGIVLILAIVTHPHQKMFYANHVAVKNNEDLISFYNKVSANYVDKLPLIFGKWTFLTNTWRYAYRWFLPVLYLNIEDEFARAMTSGSSICNSRRC